ncbi:MAG: HEAT repeat domain-containing protein [Desulfobacterales bacterium]
MAENQKPEKKTSIKQELAEALIELHFTRKNVLIYPDGHAQVEQSIERSIHALNQIFQSREKLTITIAEDTLLVGKELLDPKNKLFKELSIPLKQHDIVSVTFLKGIEKEELLRFLRLISNRPEIVREKGGIQLFAATLSLANIRIQTVDFSKLHLTEEKEIRIDRTGGEKKQPSTIWHDFVTSLTAGTLSDSEESLPFLDLNQVNPIELAHFLNEQNVDATSDSLIFEKFIMNHFSNISDGEIADPQDLQRMDNLNQLLQNLNPEIRSQFLRAVFDHCNPDAGTPKGKKILEGLGENLVLEMLHQANTEGKEISPALMSFVKKMANLNISEDKNFEERAPEIQLDTAKELFKREDYEHFVEKTYRDLLRDLSDRTNIEKTDDETFNLEEHQKTLEDNYLDSQIARVLTAFVEEDIEPEEYLDYSKRIVSISQKINPEGPEYFSFLKEIFLTFQMHAIHRSHPKLQTIAREYLKEFRKPLFIAMTVAAFDKLQDQRSSDASDFLVMLGPKIVPEAVNLYAKKENPEKAAPLIEILSNFREMATLEAQKRINDPRPAVVRNLAILIRKLGNQEIVSNLAGLLNHHDENVKLEALSALLKFKIPEAGDFLRQLLRSNQPEVVSNAIRLAGHYRVQETANDLNKMIRRVMLFQSAITQNEELIKALSLIGNPDTIPFLQKILKTSFTLYPKALSRMKQTLFETLEGYPQKDIFPLLEIGMQLKNEKIKELCQELMQKRMESNPKNLKERA